MGQIRWDFRGKKAIITGGSRGIGRAIVRKLAIAGAEVIFIYNKNRDEAFSLINELQEHNINKVTPIECDFLSMDNIQRVLTILKQEMNNKLDYLVNNAGIVRSNLVYRMSMDEWEDVIQVNLNAVFALTKGLLKPISRVKGNIINISSISGLVAGPGEANYAASKAAVIGFTNALAKEMAPLGVRVNAIAPGTTNTDMLKDIPQDDIRHVINEIPLKRLGTPEDVANLALFLLSDESSYITGETINVDGGVL